MIESTVKSTWWTQGIKKGWIGIYEQEMIQFMVKEFGALTDDETLCAVFVSLFLKAGHVCLPMNRSAQEWVKILGIDHDEVRNLPDQPIAADAFSGSKIIRDKHQATPFVLEDDRLSFRRFWNYENKLLKWVTNRVSHLSDPLITDLHKSHLDQFFPEKSDEINWQKVAAGMSVIKPFLIISGGPGTGKTTTVARILALHQRLAGRSLKIALAAPTGKAAGRMGEALTDQLKSIIKSGDERANFPSEAKTVHRLLSGIESRDNLLPPIEKKTLPYDMIVVDEASMIDLTLMNRLISHIREDTTLILLGDKDQLASVEAGSVFADLCQKKGNSFRTNTSKLLQQMGIAKNFPEQEQSSINDSIVYLTKSYRFDKESGIGALADVIKNGVADKNKLDKLFSDFDDISHHEFSYGKGEDIQKILKDLAEKVKQTKGTNQQNDLMKFWKQSVWLAVLRRGLTGTERLNQLMEKYLVDHRLVQVENGWYHGRPIMITQNDYSLGIFNGDLGVCVRSEDGSFNVFVESGNSVQKISPQRLVHFTPAFFITVHKSQGSEFDQVQLLLPREDTPLVSRELLYTAVTRSRKAFNVNGSLELVIRGIERPLERFTGLRHQIK
ncbi:MAG: exodeoxyribonuclease V subunit alpha [Balneolaceae bacterium]